MGFSLGGFTALTLPLLAPNTFSAVGANDPSTPFISAIVRDPDEIPEGVPLDDESNFTLEEFFAEFPDSLDGYRETSVVHSVYGQIAASLGPNPDNPLHGDLPFNEQGEWIPEIRDRWRELDLLDPSTVELHRSTLEQLSTATIILPQDRTLVNTPWNEELIRVHQAAGIRTQGH